jgi:predicted transcriptional regulator of viral defense system
MTPDERDAILKKYWLRYAFTNVNHDIAYALAKAEQRTPLEKAAGELLEACRAASECLDHCGGHWKTARRLRAAIDLAEAKENETG